MMPVRKFRSVEQMDGAAWRTPGDPALFRAIAALWDLGARTSRRRYPPGVHRHASVVEMQRVQERWAAESPDR